MKLIPLKRLIYGFVCLALILPLISFTNNSKIAPYRIKTIVIDAGHGGKAAGAAGKYSLEKNIALSVALKLGKVIQDNLAGVKVIYTRTTDVNVPFHERIGIANTAKADLFISIHCNSMPSNLSNRTQVKGVETFVAGYGRINEQDVAIRENADILLEKDYQNNYGGYDPKDPTSMIVFSLMKNAYREQSIKLAKAIQNEYVATGRIDRGVKEQNILVLQRAGMPAVLTEIGFISNPEEEDYLNSEAGQLEVAQSILKAIQAYKKQTEIQ